MHRSQFAACLGGYLLNSMLMRGKTQHMMLSALYPMANCNAITKHIGPYSAALKCINGSWDLEKLLFISIYYFVFFVYLCERNAPWSSTIKHRSSVAARDLQKHVSMFLVVFVLYSIAICSNVSVSWRCIRSAKAPIHSRIHLHLWQASSYDDTHYAIRANNVFVLIAERIFRHSWRILSLQNFVSYS